MYYIKCPDCGANLDPGERCDCAGSSSSAVKLLTPERIKLRQKKNISPDWHLVRYAH